jgi:hypothetical protein
MKEKEDPPTRVTNAQLVDWWTDLTCAEPAKARVAIRRMVSGSTRTVAFLRDHLRPTRSEKPEVLARLIEELGDDDFETRQHASRRLGALGEIAEGALRAALKKETDLERIHRLRNLVAALERVTIHPAQLATLRAVEVLERINNPEACALLRSLAAGAPGTRLTIEARLALRRLERKR